MREERLLHKHMLGINAATTFYEDLTEDTRKIVSTRELAPTLLRFPGGSMASYYNWQKGQIEIPVKQNSSTGLMGPRMEERNTDPSRLREQNTFLVEALFPTKGMPIQTFFRDRGAGLFCYQGDVGLIEKPIKRKVADNVPSFLISQLSFYYVWIYKS